MVFLLKYIFWKKCKNRKINSINSDSPNLHYIDWFGVNKNIWLIWSRSKKHLITNGAVYPSLGAHLDYISHDYTFCRRKIDQIDHLTFIIVQQTVQLTPQGNGLKCWFKFKVCLKFNVSLSSSNSKFTYRIITPYKFSQYFKLTIESLLQIFKVQSLWLAFKFKFKSLPCSLCSGMG